MMRAREVIPLVKGRSISGLRLTVKFISFYSFGIPHWFGCCSAL